MMRVFSLPELITTTNYLSSADASPWMCTFLLRMFFGKQARPLAFTSEIGVAAKSQLPLGMYYGAWGLSGLALSADIANRCMNAPEDKKYQTVRPKPDKPEDEDLFTRAHAVVPSSDSPPTPGIKMNVIK